MNNLLWLLLALLALVLSWFAESPILAWVAVVFILFLGLCRLLLFFSPRVEAKRTLSADTAHIGEKIGVWVRLRLTRRPWGWLLASDNPPPLPFHGNRGVMLSPGATKQVDFSYVIEATRRGYFPIGPLHLQYGDPLGFAEKRRALLGAENITVFPRLREIRRMRLPLSRAPGELLTLRRTFDDATRPSGVRDYHHGDPLRRIHWRATARAGRPQSKLYDVATSLQAMLVLNLQRADYPSNPAEASQTTELAISLAASLAMHLLSLGQRVGIITNGLDLREKEEILKETPTRLSLEEQAKLGDEIAAKHCVFLEANRTPQRQIEILGLLARLQPVRGKSLAALLEMIRAEVSWGETVFLITPSVDDDTLHAAAIAHAGFFVSSLSVGDSPLATRAYLRFTSAGIFSQQIMSEEEIGGLYA